MSHAKIHGAAYRVCSAWEIFPNVSYPVRVSNNTACSGQSLYIYLVDTLISAIGSAIDGQKDDPSEESDGKEEDDKELVEPNEEIGI